MLVLYGRHMQWAQMRIMLYSCIELAYMRVRRLKHLHLKNRPF
jgi:hypothetical protein